MIEYLDSDEDVIALRLTGRLTHDELMEIADRLERALEARMSTHLFVEMADYDGFDLTALGDYLPRALKFMRRLERFGRVAIVTDLRWIRWASRIESALLPGISYETFTLDERDQALAWVEGRSPLPHRAAFTLIETDRPDVFGFELDGRIHAEEMHRLVKQIHLWLDRVPGPVRVLGRFRNFSFPTPGGLDAEYVRMKLRALQRVERYAVVGGPAWLKAWVSALAPVLRMEFRHFAGDEEAAAWQWLGAEPGQVREQAA